MTELELFLERILDEPALEQQLDAIDDEARFVEVVSGASGVSPDEIRERMRANHRGWIERWI